MSGIVSDFSKDVAPPADDGRLDAPAYHRNAAPILAALRDVLVDSAGNVIEIGAGTGQHAVHLAPAVPHLTWWPTDPNPDHRRSIDAWRAHRPCSNVMPAMDLDAGSDRWALGAPGRPPCHDIAAILCINVLHITPWPVTLRLLHRAGALLRPDGRLLIYGPFARDGVHNAPSNVAFDRSLRQRDLHWGVRDITDIETMAMAHGLALDRVIEMPANNRMLVFTRADAG